MAEQFHKNFFTFAAETNYELGMMMGRAFADPAREALLWRSGKPDWEGEKNRAAKYLAPARTHAARYIRELEGYAESAKVDFADLWTLSLEDEVKEDVPERCTTVITNNGKLIAHNEDWNKDSENSICVVQKSISDLSIFELYYLNTLGGNAFSINSNGFIVAVNSLAQTDKKIGVPRNIITRIVSEVREPDGDVERLKNIPRGSGDNFNIVSKEGKIWNIECTAEQLIAGNPASPFVHANHYLSELRKYEASDGLTGTFERFDVAYKNMHPRMSIKEVEKISSDESKGSRVSIMNERTMARVIVDLEGSSAQIWLRREPDRGWIEYDLRGMLSAS